MPSARADGDRTLPFEVAVVLAGCTEVPFGVDRLVSTLHDRAANDALASPAGASRTIRVSFRAPACDDAQRAVRIAIEVGDGRLVRREFEVDPSGDSTDDRSVRLADRAYEALQAEWPSLLAAAGNPYVASQESARLDAPTEDVVSTDLLPNPYRRVVSRGELDVALDLVPNPYRRHAGSTIDVDLARDVASDLAPNPYRGVATSPDDDVARELMPNPYLRALLPAD